MVISGLVLKKLNMTTNEGRNEFSPGDILFYDQKIGTILKNVLLQTCLKPEQLEKRKNMRHISTWTPYFNGLCC